MEPPQNNVGYNNVYCDGALWTDVLQPYTSGGQISLPSTNLITMLERVAPTNSVANTCQIYADSTSSELCCKVNGADTVFIFARSAATGTGTGPLFTALSASAVTNQLLLGTTNITTINSVAPAASRVLSIQDPLGDCDIMLGRKKYVALPATGTTGILATQSGSIFTMQQASGNCTINLPLPSTGLSFKFLVIATSNGSNTQAITATSAILFGNILGPGGADTDVLLINASTTLTLSATANNVKSGDWLEFNSDNTNWYVTGVSAGSALGWAAS